MNDPRPRSTKFWTPEQDEYIRQHYRKIGAKTVAAHLNTTKNAVIGRANRIGVGLNYRVALAVRLAKNKIERAEMQDKPVAKRGVASERRGKPGTRLAPLEPPEETVTPLNGVGVRIWDLAPRHCKWVMGEPKDFVFCGHGQKMGSHYCEEHYEKSVVRK